MNESLVLSAIDLPDVFEVAVGSLLLLVAVGAAVVAMVVRAASLGRQHKGVTGG